jgi:hypothetical protein
MKRNWNGRAVSLTTDSEVCQRRRNERARLKRSRIKAVMASLGEAYIADLRILSGLSAVYA